MPAFRFAQTCSALAIVLFMPLHAAQPDEAFAHVRNHPAIRYDSDPVHDAVSALNRRLRSGDVRFLARGASGVLGSLLDALDVPVASQIAVFAPDSLQSSRIAAGNPRVLYFNDAVTVGWVRGGIIEIAAQDPRQGVIFYTLDPVAATPVITRHGADCLRCHESTTTLEIPGMRSSMDHRTPLERRWGAWYVTGNLGPIQHFGNVDLAKPTGPGAPNPFNWPSFDGKFDWSGYATPYSDVVALMLFEHQMQAMNLLTRIGWDARIAEHDTMPDAAAALRARATEVVDYLLFVDEAPLRARIRGTSGFDAAFSARGPRDRRGRSLRDLDLSTRLVQYRCSYMVYTPQFDALVPAAKAAIYARLWAVLSGSDRSAKYGHLARAERQSIVEILRDTKADLPASFAGPVRP